MKFHSHGKLLISGEYLVLKGAKALAVPLTFGQSLETKSKSQKGGLTWESYMGENLWFNARFDLRSLNTMECSDAWIADKLSFYLKETKKLNPDFLNQDKNIFVKTVADFNLNWGLGSSSTLISNIAYWANVDQFVLHKNVSSGSGYDVICARQNKPILFELTAQSYGITQVDFNPSFSENIYFAYLGNKQDSAKSVNQFKLIRGSLKNETGLVSELGQHIAYTENLDDFEYYIREHEAILASILKERPIKEKRFADFEGEVKSLGAWGGDFVMMTWIGTKDELQVYLKNNNIDTFFSFSEIVRFK